MGIKEPKMAIGHVQEPPMDTSYRKKPEFDDEKAKLKIIEHEGFRPDPYTDSLGFITGGIGHKFTKSDFDNFDPKWSREEKMQYWSERFEEDYERAKMGAIKIGNQYGIDMTPEKLYVLTDMNFNLGTAGVKKFKNFLSDLGKNDIEGAILEMKQVSKDNPKPSKWYKQVPNRVESLVEILRSSSYESS